MLIKPFKNSSKLEYLFLAKKDTERVNTSPKADHFTSEDKRIKVEVA